MKYWADWEKIPEAGFQKMEARAILVENVAGNKGTKAFKIRDQTGSLNFSW